MTKAAPLQAPATRPVRAMLCTDLSGPGGLKPGELCSAPPGPDEVRVAVRACGVNFPDLLMSRGQYQFKPEPPFSPGMETSGVVLDVGRDVEAFRPGDRVIARTQSMYPGFTEEVTLPAKFVLPIPDSVDHDTAAALFVTYQTAYNALIERAALAPGEWVLVNGASGGVGLAAVQIARACGARVIAATGSPDKARFLQREGAEVIVHAETPDLRTRIKDITGGRGVDVVLDPVGGAAFDGALRCLVPGGRMLIVGFTSGTISSMKANYVLIKEISLIGIRAGEYGLRHPQKMRAAYDQLIAWLEQGRIAPRISARYPLDRAADALAALEDRAAIGKIVVQIT